MKTFTTLTRREDGQTMAEYGVVLAVITLAVVVALAALSGAIGDAINAVTGVLSTLGASRPGQRPGRDASYPYAAVAALGPCSTATGSIHKTSH